MESIYPVAVIYIYIFIHDTLNAALPWLELTERAVCDYIAYLMPAADPIATALNQLAKSNKESAETIAEGLHDIANALRNLGNGNTHAPGAIEFIGMALRDGLGPIAEAIRERE